MNHDPVQEDERARTPSPNHESSNEIRVGSNAEPPNSISTMPDESGSSALARQPTKEGLKARLRRGSSKLLSLFGLRSSAAVNALPTHTGSTSGRECVDPQPLASAPVKVGSDYNAAPLSRDSIPGVARPSSGHSRTSDFLDSPVGAGPAYKKQRIKKNPGLLIQPQKRKSYECNSQPVFPDVEPNQSSLNLPDLFARKLSAAFANSTIIHRAHLRSRPGIWPSKDSMSTVHTSDQLGDCVNSSSDPSTTPSGGSSSPKRRQSTLLTSEGPSLVGHRCTDLLGSCVRESLLLPTRDYGSDEGLQLVGAGLNAAPSIVTAEAASAAKIFFETHFSSIFSNRDPRLQRQCELETRIHSLPLTVDEQIRTLNNWINQETDYLRQCRVLKTRSNRIKCNEAISLAGFEVVKVLGKGSFGVVRLVKEKKADENECTVTSQTDVMAPEAESPNAKGNTIDVLRSAIESAKRSRRRMMSCTDKDVFAMKVIRKSDMLQNTQEGHMRAERDFLVASERSRWVVPLIASFQDTDHLYLVMDYMIGGDFLGYLIREDILSEHVTRWYIAEMILCIEETHRLGWIHRDIKPDNFLISASGHLKISDFGLAFDGHWAHDQTYYNNHRRYLVRKLGIGIIGDKLDQKEAADRAAEDREFRDTIISEPPSVNLLEFRDKKERRKFARSVVGTSQYMSPEVIQGPMYDGRCDWWSLGVILYECLFGFTPFTHDTRFGTKLKIVNHLRTLCFPNRPSDKLVSMEARDLIIQLLQEKEYRLCSSKYRINDLNLRSISRDSRLIFNWALPPYKNYESHHVYADDATDIKSHPFFRGIKWDLLPASQPPFIPKVRSWEDTRYFDEVDVPPSAKDSDPATVNNRQGGYAEATSKLPGQVLPQKAEPVKTAKTWANKVLAPKKSSAKVQKKVRERKRARDKLLRDDILGKAVLEIRKQKAFVGYTYRRPKETPLAIGCDRGRSLMPRGQINGLFGFS